MKKLILLMCSIFFAFGCSKSKGSLNLGGDDGDGRNSSSTLSVADCAQPTGLPAEIQLHNLFPGNSLEDRQIGSIYYEAEYYSTNPQDSYNRNIEELRANNWFVLSGINTTTFASLGLTEYLTLAIKENKALIVETLVDEDNPNDNSSITFDYISVAHDLEELIPFLEGISLRSLLPLGHSFQITYNATEDYNSTFSNYSSTLLGQPGWVVSPNSVTEFYLNLVPETGQADFSIRIPPRGNPDVQNVTFNDMICIQDFASRIGG